MTDTQAELKNLRVALAAYGKFMERHNEALPLAVTEEQQTEWFLVEKENLQVVQDAYYEDTKEWNKKEYCRRCGVEFFKNLIAIKDKGGTQHGGI